MQDDLLKPFRLKHLTLKNRIFSACHEPNISEDGLPKERYRLYHEEKCKGGIGLCMFGGSSNVSRESEDAFGNLDLTSDRIIPYLKKLSETTHKYDVPLICQITHMGRRNSGNKGNWLPVVSASSVREFAHRAFPKALEVYEIKRIVKDYAKAAKRCQEGGLDGIELQCYSHLMDSFFSPITNHRDDEYSCETLENKTRFAKEVIYAIREAVGPSFIIGIRMVVDEGYPDGFGFDEGLDIAKELESTKELDFFNVIVGQIDSDQTLANVIPNMGTPVAPFLEQVKRVKDALSIPVIHSSRINDIATARHCIRGDYMDLVGMTRAHFADPHLINKVMLGEEDRIRPCVGASFCLDRIYRGGSAYCIHNAATMREKTMSHVINKVHETGKNVVVIGGGVAGLEAARVCQSRGHHVKLIEAQDKVGGQVLLASQLPRRSELIGIVDWLLAECMHLGVTIEYNTYVDAQDVVDLEPDIVIDATGGIPNTEFVKGGDFADTTWDILSGSTVIKNGAVIYDENGDHPALTCAEYMLTKNCQQMHYITRDRMLGHELGGTNYPAYYKALYNSDCSITLNTKLIEITKKGENYCLTLVNEYSHKQFQITTPQIIIEHGTLPITDLYESLKPHSKNLGEYDQDALVNQDPQAICYQENAKFQLFRIGDAQSSRNIHASIYDALRLCLTL